MAADDVCRELMDRFRRLEQTQAKLRIRLESLMEERSKEVEDGGTLWQDSGWDYVPRYLSCRSPHRTVLDSMGHAVYVFTPCSGEIIYWNRSAENLYGWKDYEILGQRIADHLIDEAYNGHVKKIMEKLTNGQSWSGQFPLKKRSGEIFMAIVTKSPLYEDGDFVGVITVSSDAALFNNITSQNLRTYGDRANCQPKVWGLNLKKIQWQSQPQIASSISNLASKILSQNCGEDACNPFAISQEKEKHMLDLKDDSSEKSETLDTNPRLHFDTRKSRTDGWIIPEDESAFQFAQPYKTAAKVLAKLRIWGGEKNAKGGSRSFQQNKAAYSSVYDEVKEEPNYHRDAEESSPNCCSLATKDKGEDPHKNNVFFSTQKEYSSVNEHGFPNTSVKRSSKECRECFAVPRLRCSSPILSFQLDEKESESRLDDMKVSGLQNMVQQHLDVNQSPGTGESINSNHGSSSSKTDSESSPVSHCEIQWEDLHFAEEIGQGSYAAVYHGIWNGSDIAIKVYFGNEYNEGTLRDYKKEIDIMRRLRHPNVLLFMGAVCSQERLAIVTELLPRGSLFRVLHKSNQVLDIRRCLRMALDVARGMNYLHHRNPPIVHRDLKSSNLLVDKNWNVKVGDFGLSKLKQTTFLTAKSGRGTPQWMAPEVLRNDPSNEKSDVFSFGVILWELMTQSIPWGHLNSLQIVGIVGFMDRRLDLPEGLDPRVSSIISDCWKSNPAERPSFQDIIHLMASLIQTLASESVREARGLNLSGV